MQKNDVSDRLYGLVALKIARDTQDRKYAFTASSSHGTAVKPL